MCSCKIKIEILGSECQTSGTYAKTAKQATKKVNAAACLCFLKYLALLRPEADRTDSIIPLGCKPRSFRRVSLGWFDYSKKERGRTIQLRNIRQ
jgi:hypothetical protein